MIKITQHIPNCVDIGPLEPESYEVETLQDVFAIDWVASWTEDADFHSFCISKEEDLLMVENEDGTWWWVIAYVEGLSKDDLPIVRMVDK